MLCVKVGMESERKLVSRTLAPDVLVLTGIATTPDQLGNLVPPDCKAIISLGTCGALHSTIAVGDIFACSTLCTPEGWFRAAPNWFKSIAGRVRVRTGPWWSSGEANSSNTVGQRAGIYRRTGCLVVDDETFAVAKFADARGIPFQALRSVSDLASTTLPPAVSDALREDGSTDIAKVLVSVIKNPFQIPALVDTAVQFRKSMEALRVALAALGPQLQWSGKA